MAVTIIVSPQLYDTVYNEMTYTASSTNSGNTDFKYLADIYINGAVTKTARLKIPIEPGTGSAYCILDVHRILEAYLTSDFGDNSGVVATTACPNSILSYQVKWGEEYGSTLTQYPDLTVDTVRYAWNSSMDYPDFTNLGYLTYYLDDTDARFLTNAPVTQETTLDSSGWLYHLPDNAPKITSFEIKTYSGLNGTGSNIGTWAMKNSLTSASTSELMAKVAAWPFTIAAQPNSEFSTGVQPVFAGTELSYTFEAQDVSRNPLSEIRTFNLVEACKYPRQTVHFLNELGGFDVKNFNLARKDSHDIERRFMKKNPQRITSAGAYPFSVEDRQNVQYYTKSTHKMTLTSDWISEAESVWLRELLESPEIYIEDDSNTMIAVKGITSSSYSVKTDRVDKLYNLEIELELGYNNYRQRG